MQHKSTVSVYIQEIAENQNTLELIVHPLNSDNLLPRLTQNIPAVA